MNIFRITQSKWIFGLIAASFLFISGEFVGARYSTIREMESNRSILLQNIEILRYCKSSVCSEQIQRTVIGANDIAFQRYETLKNGTENFAGRVFWYTIWPIIDLLYSEPRKNNSMEVVQELYLKMGCGLNGVICAPKTRPED